MHVEGMMCPMCERHMNEAIEKAFDVKKVTSSHTEKKTEIIAKEAMSEAAILEATKETGYVVSDIRCEEKKFSLFGR